MATQVEKLADFAASRTYTDLSLAAKAALKARVLDALGCAIGALSAEPIAAIRAHVQELGGRPFCSLIGGGDSAPDRAALLNGALVRYLDYNDSYLAPKETCHPSDNLAAVIAAGELAGASGAQFLTALAIAYQVQCRLSDAAPLRDKGLDHTVQLAFSAAAGAAHALSLDPARAASAIGIAGTANLALRVTRTGKLSQWKGLAAPWASSRALEAALLARRGITGPLEVFEGNKGLMDLAGKFEIDWEREDLERVTKTVIKRYNAEVHSQSALEALLELREAYSLRPEDVEQIELDTFDVAFKIIGGGEEGEKHHVATKEQADHSLPYLLAVALADGEVTPAQFELERIEDPAILQLMDRVTVRANPELSRRFPAEHAVRLKVARREGPPLIAERSDFLGSVTRPQPYDAVVRKFDALASGHAGAALREAIVDAVWRLDELGLRHLTHLLESIGRGEPWLNSIQEEEEIEASPS